MRLSSKIDSDFKGTQGRLNEFSIFQFSPGNATKMLSGLQSVHCTMAGNYAFSIVIAIENVNFIVTSIKFVNFNNFKLTPATLWNSYCY